MKDSTIKELQDQNHRLRSLVLSLSATLLRKIAIESEVSRSLDSAELSVWSVKRNVSVRKNTGIKE